jgi:hypothetical protein
LQFPPARIILKVSVSDITADSSGWQQTISFTHQGKLRREIFAARSLEELHQHVTQRRRELERNKKGFNNALSTYTHPSNE